MKKDKYIIKWKDDYPLAGDENFEEWFNNNKIEDYIMREMFIVEYLLEKKIDKQLIFELLVDFIEITTNKKEQKKIVDKFLQQVRSYGLFKITEQR
jgi:uncharacterized protein YktA (UPF0223 family)